MNYIRSGSTKTVHQVSDDIPEGSQDEDGSWYLYTDCGRAITGELLKEMPSDGWACHNCKRK